MASEAASRVKWGIGVLGVIALMLFALEPSALMEWVERSGFGRTEHIRLGAYEGDVGALQWIAKEQGFYEQVGLDVDLKGYPSGKEATDALKAGAVDVATASDYVFATLVDADPSLRIIGNISYYRNKGVVALRDHGITTPADLKGKRIGLTSPSGAEYALNVFLALHGLTVKDVNTVAMPPKQLVEAMNNGSIDATITWQPHVDAIEKKLGAAGVSFQGDGLDVYLLMIMRDATLNESSRAARKLLRALVLAEKWAQTHPEEAKRFIATRFKLEPPYVEAQWKRMQLAVTLPQELLVTLDGEARWLAQRHDKPATSMPNFSNFIRPEELRAVKPAAVTLYSELKAPGSRAAEERVAHR